MRLQVDMNGVSATKGMSGRKIVDFSLHWYLLGREWWTGYSMQIWWWASLNCFFLLLLLFNWNLLIEARDCCCWVNSQKIFYLSVDMWWGRKPYSLFHPLLLLESDTTSSGKKSLGVEHIPCHHLQNLGGWNDNQTTGTASAGQKLPRRIKDSFCWRRKSLADGYQKSLF